MSTEILYPHEPDPGDGSEGTESWCSQFKPGLQADRHIARAGRIVAAGAELSTIDCGNKRVTCTRA